MKKYIKLAVPVVLLALAACEKPAPNTGTGVLGNLSDEVNIECCYPENIYSMHVDEGFTLDSIAFGNGAVSEWLTVYMENDLLMVHVGANEGEATREESFGVFSGDYSYEVSVVQTPEPTMYVEYKGAGIDLDYYVELGEGATDMRIVALEADVWDGLLNHDKDMIVDYMLSQDSPGVYDYSDYLELRDSDGTLNIGFIGGSTGVFCFALDKDGNVGDYEERIGIGCY